MLNPRISKDGVFENYPTSENDQQLFLPPDQFVGKAYHKILPSNLSKLLDQKIEQLVKTNQVQQFDYSIELSGKTKWYSAKMSIRKDASGEFAGVTLVSRDITLRKQAEENVRRLNEELEDRVSNRTKQLEEKNKELEAFSYSISHDLRAPLRAISGFSKILLDESKHSLNTEGLQFLERIDAASHKMNDLIESLLSLSQLSRQNVDFQKVNISELAATVFNSLKQSDARQNIDFKIKLELEETHMVQGDRQLLEVLLNNLFSNAIKFSASRNPAVIEFGSFQQNGETVYYVKDNGVGFDQTNADKIFDPFHRLHSPEEYEGTGIGLAIVHRVINRHRGEIWVESKINIGTSFYFSLGDLSTDE